MLHRRHVVSIAEEAGVDARAAEIATAEAKAEEATVDRSAMMDA